MPFPAHDLYPSPTVYPTPDAPASPGPVPRLFGEPKSATWIFVLANSKDLSHIAELTQARSRTLQLALNRPGSASFTMPMKDPDAASISPLSTALKIYRISAAGVRLIWSGFVATIDEDVSGNHMTVNCVGWQDRLSKRILRRRKVYQAQDDAAIIFDLLAEANLTTAPDGYAVPIVTGSSPNTPTWIQAGTTLPNEGPGGATGYQALTNTAVFGPNAARNKTYEIYTPIGPEIQTWSDLESGCDIDVTPDTRTLNIYRKKMTDRPGAVFGYNWGPNNISQLGRQIDSTTVVNYELAVGRPQITPQFADDIDPSSGMHPSQMSYGLIEEVANISDAQNQGVLRAYAGAEVLLRQQPRVIYTITPFSYTESGRVPEPFVDYDIGDLVYLTAKHGARINVQGQAMRIFGLSVTITEEGNEQIGQLQLSPGG